MRTSGCEVGPSWAFDRRRCARPAWLLVRLRVAAAEAWSGPTKSRLAQPGVRQAGLRRWRGRALAPKWEADSGLRRMLASTWICAAWLSAPAHAARQPWLAGMLLTSSARPRRQALHVQHPGQLGACLLHTAR